MPTPLRKIRRSVGTSGPLVYFSTENASDYSLGDLWRTDGTPAGTVLLKQGLTFNSFSGDVTGLTTARMPGQLLFTADEGTGMELWKSDGTPAGTGRLANIHPALSARVKLLAAWKGKVFFAAGDPIHGRELWVTDGTAQGTHRVEDREPGAASSYPDWASVTGGKLFVSYGIGKDGTSPLRQVFPSSPAVQPLAPEASGAGVALRVSLTADGTSGELFHEYGSDALLGQRTASQPAGGTASAVIFSQTVPLPVPPAVLFYRPVFLVGTQRLEGGIQRVILSGGVVGRVPPWLPYRLHALQDETVLIRADRLPAASPDPDGDLMTVDAAGPASLEGGTVQLNQGIINYRPALGFRGADSFGVQATQAGGVTFTLPVEVMVVEPESLPHRLLPAAPPAAIRSEVLPGRWYRMERSSDPLAWLPLGEVRADAVGSFVWHDSLPTGGRAFYRAIRIP